MKALKIDCQLNWTWKFEKKESRSLEELREREGKIEKLSNDLNEANKQISALRQDVEAKSNQITAYLIEIKDIGNEKNQLNEKIVEKYELDLTNDLNWL